MTTYMKTITVRTKRQALNTILHGLGHQFSGSAAAQIAMRMIETDDNEDALALIVTHPDLPGTRVVVPWEYEA